MIGRRYASRTYGLSFETMFPYVCKIRPATLIFLILAGHLSFHMSRVAWSAPEKTRVCILMEEKVMGVFGTTGFERPGQAETTLTKEFVARGYDVVDSTTIRKNITQAQGLKALEGDDQAAAAIGLRYGAQFSVVGTAISKQAGSKLHGTQLQTIHATVTARLIRNDDARIVASASAAASRAHLDEVQGGALVIEEAARDIAKQLDEKFSALFRDTEEAPLEMVLNISGLKSFRHLDFIISYLEGQVPGIKSVSLHSFTAGVGELTVKYSGDLRDLAGKLAGEEFSGFRLEPTNVVSNRIDLIAVEEK